MKNSNFLCKENIANHFRYRWYLYVLALIAAVAVPTIIFSVSSYESSENKRIDFFMVNTGSVESAVRPVFDKLVNESDAGKNTETVTYEFISDDSTGTMEQILTVRMMCKEKDIIISDGTVFQSYASQGFFLPLDDMIPEEFSQLLSDRNIRTGHACVSNDEKVGDDHLYGIPLSALSFLTGGKPFYNDQLYISVFYDTGNDVNVKSVINKIIEYGMYGESAPGLQ